MAADTVSAILLSAGTLYTLGFVLSLAIYNVFLKKYFSGANTLISLFWINLFTYLFYVGFYLFKRFYFRHDVYAIEKLIHEYTFYDAPLYILLALGFVGSFVMLEKLIQKFEISIIIGFSQISLLFSAIGVILFGGPYSWQSILGLSIVFLGSILVPLKNFSLTNPLAPFLNLSPALIYNIFIYSLLLTNERVITFLITQKTGVTQKAMGSFQYIFPTAFQTPFFFNLGSRFFITLIFWLYLRSKAEYWGKLISTLKNYILPIAITSVIYTASAFSFQFAFALTENKIVLGSLAKLTVPTLIILSYIFLREKITLPKIIGSAIIVLGGAIVLFL